MTTRTQKAAFNARKIIFWTRLPVMNSQKLPGKTVILVLCMQWMKSLRKYFWELPPGSNKPPWDDGRSPKTPDDTRIEPPIIERIGHPDRDNKKIEYFKDRWAHTLKKQPEWGPWEWFCFKMAANISRVEPHYPDFIGLLVSTFRLPLSISLQNQNAHPAPCIQTLSKWQTHKQQPAHHM
jgi:hypothetical protein